MVRCMFYIVIAKPCYAVMVQNSLMTSPVLMTYGDVMLVECQHVEGFRTPGAEKSFNISCLFDGADTYLGNVTQCNSKLATPTWAM